MAKQPISNVDLTLFFRQLATLVSAGIAITQAFEILEKSTHKIRLRLLIGAIKQQILSGKTFFNSLISFTRYFDHLTCQLIKIGDESGKLDLILHQVAEHKEKQLALNKKIKQACFYPAITLASAIILLSLMLLLVVPKFKVLFQSMNNELPAMSQWIFYFADIFELVFISISLFGAMIFICFREKLSTFMQYLVLHLPIINNMMQKIIFARFTRQLALTLTAGIPITKALYLTNNLCQQQRFNTHIERLQAYINQGHSLHHAMHALPFFPELMVQMVKVGECSGKLELMLEKIAIFYETEIDQLTHYLTQLVEPLIMLILGVLIGGLVIGMYLPIFKISSGL